MDKKKAVILLSGGLDSATCGVLARKQGFEIYALSFAYGQKNSAETIFAKKIADYLQVKEHKFVSIDLGAFGNSALTDDIDVPKNKQGYHDQGIPITYVPARNTIFLSYALAYAEVKGVFDIFIGANQIDYSGYPDCRDEYLDAYEKMANLATKNSGKNQFRINRPLVNFTKSEIVRIGIENDFDYSMTMSCYDPVLKDEKYHACGACDSCFYRLNAFAKNNTKDPQFYDK